MLSDSMRVGPWHIGAVTDDNLRLSSPLLITIHGYRYINACDVYSLHMFGISNNYQYFIQFPPTISQSWKE